MFQPERTNQLYLKAKVELCDYTQRIYAQPVDGAKVLRKNQANKWEVKMLCGPEYLSRHGISCLLYTSPSPRDRQKSRMPSSA